jgi:hypothetical protein
MMKFSVGEDIRTRGARRTRIKETSLLWSGPISPTIQGRMKEVEYSRVSRGGVSRLPGSSAALLTDRGSALTRYWISPPSLGKGSCLVMWLKSHGTREVLMDPH